VSKKKRLLEIIAEIQKLYPHLDRLMVTDLENPDSIIITSENRIENRIDEIAEELGIDSESVEEITEEDLDELALLTWEDDDDDNGGLLQ